MADKSPKKQRGRPFKSGQSGNPNGRPEGSRNKATLAIEALLDGEAEEITRKVIEKAKAGDSVALRLCLERICPPRRERPVMLVLPPVDQPAGVVQATAAVLRAMAAGEITPAEAREVAAILDGQRRAIETDELERRIAALEQEREKGGGQHA